MIVLSYNGVLTFEKIDELLSEFKEKADNSDIEKALVRRVYSTLVELLENVYKHNSAEDEDVECNLVELNLVEENNNFEIEIGNYIGNDKIESFSNKIDFINSFTKVELNALYRESISESRISDKGGAGLGIIEIARNSKGLIKYKLVKELKNISFVSINVLVGKKSKII